MYGVILRKGCTGRRVYFKVDLNEKHFFIVENEKILKRNPRI